MDPNDEPRSGIAGGRALLHAGVVATSGVVASAPEAKAAAAPTKEPAPSNIPKTTITSEVTDGSSHSA